MDDSGCEDVIAELRSIGRDLKREDVLDCFCHEALRALIFEQGVSFSPSNLFAKLQESISARDEIHELERGMDKAHFVELVTGGYFMAAGVDKLTGYPIFWRPSGLLEQNTWRYKSGSPREKAYILCIASSLVASLRF